MHCIATFLVTLLVSVSAVTAVLGVELAPLRVLLVTGGCCHNYTFQAQALSNAIARTTAVRWTVVNDGGNGTRAEIDLYKNANWAEGFDAVIHNECFADTADTNYIRRITSAHKDGVAAVVIHCAMHTYRAATIDDWREFLGVTSRRHDHQSRYPVKWSEPGHPILKDVPQQWTTPMDELYVIEKVWPNTKVLATSASERNGREHAVFWTNQYGKARVFGTTYGHTDDTFKDPVFLGVVTRGLLWAAGRLD
ncbi:MAG TPA: ThuA domain-containing protein [Verrucomicrobiae bacterium]|nr:ThuA domain-containing protein [Verrucomicrobiae bacterium]